MAQVILDSFDIDTAYRKLIVAALAESNGVVRHAARLLGVTEYSLRRHLARLGIEPGTYRPSN